MFKSSCFPACWIYTDVEVWCNLSNATIAWNNVCPISARWKGFDWSTLQSNLVNTAAFSSSDKIRQKVWYLRQILNTGGSTSVDKQGNTSHSTHLYYFTRHYVVNDFQGASTSDKMHCVWYMTRSLSLSRRAMRNLITLAFMYKPLVAWRGSSVSHWWHKARNYGKFLMQYKCLYKKFVCHPEEVSINRESHPDTRTSPDGLVDRESA